MKDIHWALSTCLYLSILVCFVSCKKRITNKADLITYINDPRNGLQKSQRVREIQVGLTCKPWQLMVSKSKLQGGSLENANKIKDKLFFVLSLSANNKELLKQLPFSQYSEIVQVLAFRMNSFINITPDRDKTVEPLNCTFQQTFGMGLANNLLIVFDKKKLISASNIRVHIKEFGLNIGDLYFDIDVSDIKKIQDITVN